ncbi:MAG: hypothetical protein EOP04_08825 [Proteobacteria bacterium]|nr:MAG: hypothetical protein EOP04_08825 [Pseudomonadota bacterium]
MNSIDRHLKTDDGLRTPAARLDYSNNHWLRIFVASETLAIVKAEKIPQLGLYLSIPQTWVTQSSLISKKELRERLEPLSSDQLVNLGRKLLDEQWANILPMGGALRDLASIDAYFEKNWFQFPVVRLTADLQNGYDRESILRAIATYQQYVLSLARVNTAELMEASFNPVLTPNTRAWEVFCTSGLIKPCGSIFE